MPISIIVPEGIYAMIDRGQPMLFQAEVIAPSIATNLQWTVSVNGGTPAQFAAGSAKVLLSAPSLLVTLEPGIKTSDMIAVKVTDPTTATPSEPAESATTICILAGDENGDSEITREDSSMDGASAPATCPHFMAESKSVAGSQLPINPSLAQSQLNAKHGHGSHLELVVASSDIDSEAIGRPHQSEPAAPNDSSAGPDSSMTLEAYAVNDRPQVLVPAPPTRDWMDAINNGHAYRCLPLAIGNTYGWQLLLPVDVTAEWNGGPELSDIVIKCSHPHQAVSNFKCGILTFDIGYIFRTPPGFHLLVTGPSNTFKDGIAPMTAVVETDWLPYTFTFNYRFTRPGRVLWKAGEPYAQICLVPAAVQENVQPVIRRLRDNPKLAADHKEWLTRRSSLRTRQNAGDPEAWKRAWDRDYYLGRYADGHSSEAAHTMKMRLKAPVDERQG
jgi:hypothetical protein